MSAPGIQDTVQLYVHEATHRTQYFDEAKCEIVTLEAFCRNKKSSFHISRVE